MTRWSLTLKRVNAILVFFLCLEYASELLVFASPGNEAQDISSATRSSPVSDREKAGLRGPARTCVEENDLPDGRKYSTAWEYSPDGKLLTTRVRNPDGSEWLTKHTYHSDGRLAKIVSGKPGGLGSETVYAYDEAGSILAITNNGGEGGRTEFHYDEQGRKTSIQYFDPKVLERAQNSAYSVSPWDAATAGIGVPLGGNVTTIYDQNDQPTEAQINDAAGRLVSRFVRKYDENGHVSEEKPFLENPAALFLDRLPAEERAKLNPVNPAEINAFRTLLAGRAPAGNSFSYDTQGRISKTWERNMMFEKTSSIIYNEQGDKAVESTTLTDNSVIPTGVVYQIDEHGALVPSQPVVEPKPLPLPERSEVHFAYQYDTHGNWTQQTANYVSGGIASSQVRSRNLTYY